MSRSRAIALSLLLCAPLTTGCSNSASLFKRDPPPDEMLKRPPLPVLAPADASDNDVAEERIRMGAYLIKLVRKFDDLACYVVECKPAEK